MSAKKRQDEVLSEIGLKLDKVAGSACRVFCGVTNAQLAEDGLGWAAVANYSAAMFGGGMNDNTTVTFASFAEMLRKAFARVEAPDRQLVPFEQLKPVVRNAWEAVARHMGNVFNFERDQVGQLDRHEKRMVAYAVRGFRN